MEFDFEKQPGLIKKSEKISQETYKPLISIITPFFNAGAHFEQTFNCVINQTFPWFEWIIVDDGSSNKSDTILLEKLIKEDFRIKVFHEKNKGPAAARNFAVSKTNTEIIVSLDADDLIGPTYLELTYFALYFNKEATWAYTDSLGFGEMQYVWQVPFDSEKLKKRNFLIEVGTFRKEKFKAVGGYDDAQKHSHEDWNLWLRFLAQGGYPVHISSLSAWYRIVNNGALHQTNDHKEVRKRAFERINEVAMKIDHPVKAIEFPRIKNMSEQRLPGKIDWNLKKDKKRNSIVLILSKIGKGEEDNNLRIIDELLKKEYDVGVIFTEICDGIMIQEYTQKLDEVYVLPEFLDMEDYASFIYYYLFSRQTDIIMLDNNIYGCYLVPWVRNALPNLKIISFAWKGSQELWNLENNRELNSILKKWSNEVCLLTNDWQGKLEQTFNRVLENEETVTDSQKYESLITVYLFQYQKQSVLINDMKEQTETKWNKIVGKIKKWKKKRQY